MVNGKSTSLGQLGCGLLLGCGSLAGKVLIGGDINFAVPTYNPHRAELRAKVQKALNQYFKNTNLPNSYQEKVSNNTTFLDVIGKKVQQSHPDIDIMSKDDFYTAVKTIIGKEAVKRIAVDHRDSIDALGTIDLASLTGLDLSIYQSLNTRFGPERLNVIENRDFKIKAFIFEARAKAPNGTDMSKPNEKLAGKLIKAVIFQEFDAWFEATDGPTHTGFEDFVIAMATAAGEAMGDALADKAEDVLGHIADSELVQDLQVLVKAGTKVFEEGQKVLHDGKVLIAKGTEFYDDAGELVGNIDDLVTSVDTTVDAVGAAATAIGNAADSGATVEVTATVELTGANDPAAVEAI